MTKKVLELSLSFFLIACGISLLVAIFAIIPVINSSLQLVDDSHLLLQDSRTLVGEMTQTVTETNKAQNDLTESFNNFRDVVIELGTAAAVIAMAEEKIIGPTDANKLVAECLDKVAERSERLGKLGKYLNDYRIEQTRK